MKKIKTIWPLLLCVALLAGCSEEKEAAVPAERSEAEITSFYFTQLHNPDAANTEYESGIEGRVDAEIDQQARTIFLQFPVGGVNLTALKASFESSFGSVVRIGQTAQVSNVSVNDFSRNWTYTVTSEDGTKKNDYAVTVVNGQNTATDLYFFSFMADGMDDDGLPTTDNITCLVDPVNGRITGEVKYEVDLTAVKPAFRAAPRAKVYIGPEQQSAGVTVADLSSPVDYSVRAEDGTTQDYRVEISKLPAWTGKDLTSLTFSKADNPTLDSSMSAEIDETQNKVTLVLASDFDATAIKPLFALSPKATAKIGTADLVAGNSYNFETATTLTVTAQDGSTHVYEIALKRVKIGALTILPAQVTGATLTASGTDGDIYTFSSISAGATATTETVDYIIPGKVLSFTYTSTQAVNMRIALNSAESKLFPLEPTATEKEYSFDLSLLMTKGLWNNTVSGLTITFETGGSTIVMKDLMIRLHNASELNSLYMYGLNGDPLFALYEDITEYDTPGMQAFRLTSTTVGWNHANIWIGSLDERLTSDMRYFSFEFKTESGAANDRLHLALRLAAGARVSLFATYGDAMQFGYMSGNQYSATWRKVTVDLSALTATDEQGVPLWSRAGPLFPDHYAASIPFAPSRPLHFGVLTSHAEGGEGVAVCFRGLHFHKSFPEL